jgi:hypothetical protein
MKQRFLMLVTFVALLSLAFFPLGLVLWFDLQREEDKRRERFAALMAKHGVNVTFEAGKISVRYVEM